MRRARPAIPWRIWQTVPRASACRIRKLWRCWNRWARRTRTIAVPTSAWWLRQKIASQGCHRPIPRPQPRNPQPHPQKAVSEPMQWGRAWPLAILCGGILSAQVYVGNLPVDHAAIRYFERPLTDRASRLARELESGAAHLNFRDDGFGYLASLLERFGITVDSQALVFSKTSFQGALVSPRNP